MPSTGILEQREHKRFEIPEAIIVISGNIGQLVNISSGGLAFKCFHTISLPEKPSLDILVAGRDFHLQQLPVELVWNECTDHPSFLSMPTENAGVKFDNVHQPWKAMLDYLFSQL